MMKRFAKYLMFVVAILLLASCGSSTATDNPPNVAGTYDCTAGCIGVCIFADVLIASQDGANVSTTSATASCVGEIDNDGNGDLDCVAVDGSTQTCEGQFAAGTFIGDCRFDVSGITCQTVSYTRR